MPKHGAETVPHGEILTFEEILRLSKIFARLGTKRIRVTGGEPLVRKGTAEFIGELKKIGGIKAVTLTSNGTLLEQHLEALVEAQIDGINISLDTLNPHTHKFLTGSDDHGKIMSAIEKCAKRLPVKLNCVPIDGINDRELADIAALAKTVTAVRFIELMPVGLGADYKLITAQRIIETLEAAYGTLKPCDEQLGSGPAHYYTIDGFPGRIGMINAISHEFCGRCNRIRLTSEGWLKLCLAHDEGISLKSAMRAGASDTELARMISRAVKLKPEMHGFGEAGISTRMHSIGG
jgi:cyclic pyranopterin phosphate synthase